MASSESEDSAMAQHVRVNDAYGAFKHNAAIGMLVLAPVLIAIPPRKLDLYTFSLGGAFVASLNQLNVERTGKGLISQFGYNNKSPWILDGSKQRAEENSGRRLLEEKSSVPDEVLRRGAGNKGLLEEKAKEIWMGGETEGWKERRLREEQEKLNKGEGYADMIVDQIWEVWNWGEKKGKELKERDEDVIRQKEREQEKDSKTGK